MRNRTFFIAAAAATFVAAPALAHPKLVAANPAPNASVKATSQLRLTFSEALIAKFSGADVVMTEMPGMKMHAPMRVPATAALGPDNKSLVLALPKPLARGSYRLDWHVVSTDTHRVNGSYAFKVG
jgi:methionine-rich copper-binding protein CopC